MTYYDDLTKDKKRVDAFYEAIDKNAHGIVYDLGTGSGILAIRASHNSQNVIAIENNPLIIKQCDQKLKKFENIRLINADASKYNMKSKPDVIICEMLDTALIDEEQVPVMNNAHKYAKDDTIYIPKAAYSTIELISTKINTITYYENNHPQHKILSQKKIYSNIDLTSNINPKVNQDITINVTTNGLLNAIKITTYAVVTDEIILEPTPMLNPPLLIPLDEKYDINKGEEIIINLQYIMGGGLNTVKATRK